MSNDQPFQPARRTGLIFHFAAIGALLGSGLWGLWQATQASIGPVFLLFLAPTLLAVSLAPVLVYYAYALQTSSYQLSRDGIRLRWGLRSEDIPMNDIDWVRLSSELPHPLPLPWLRWPGAVLGVRHIQDTGPVEYIASSSQDLVIIAARKSLFAISPANPQAFLQSFRRLTELGSLSPLPARSLYPTLLVGKIWEDRVARYLLLAGLVLGVALLILISLSAPGRSSIHLGFFPDGTPGDQVPPVRLLLLSVLDGIIFLGNLFLGLIFYRRQESQFLSYLLWGSSVVTPVLFLISVFFILRAG